MSLKTIDILPTAQAAEGYDMSSSVAVVIDVLRATSVITRALDNGAAAVAPVLSPEEGLSMADKLGRENVILGGERNADIIPGFDLGNSPQDYTPERVGGKTVVMTTTNGTLAIRNSAGARAVVIASMLNYERAANRAYTLCEALACDKIVFVCSGNYGQMTIEDCFCAAIVADCVIALADGSSEFDILGLFGKRDVSKEISFANDQSAMIHDLARLRAPEGQDLFPLSAHYQRLSQKGYDADIAECLEHPAAIRTVPVLSADGLLRF